MLGSSLSACFLKRYSCSTFTTFKASMRRNFTLPFFDHKVLTCKEISPSLIKYTAIAAALFTFIGHVGGKIETLSTRIGSDDIEAQEKRKDLLLSYSHCILCHCDYWVAIAVRQAILLVMPEERAKEAVAVAIALAAEPFFLTRCDADAEYSSTIESVTLALLLSIVFFANRKRFATCGIRSWQLQL